MERRGHRIAHGRGHPPGWVITCEIPGQGTVRPASAADHRKTDFLLGGRIPRAKGSMASRRLERDPRIARRHVEARRPGRRKGSRGLPGGTTLDELLAASALPRSRMSSPALRLDSALKPGLITDWGEYRRMAPRAQTQKRTMKNQITTRISQTNVAFPFCRLDAFSADGARSRWDYSPRHAARLERAENPALGRCILRAKG